MVFHSVSKSEIPPLPVGNSSMASTFSTAKSQPLHNFPLSNLKWSMNQSNTQRLRRPPDPIHLSPSHHSDHRHVSPPNNDHHRSARKHGDSGQSPDPRPSFRSTGKNEHRLIKLSYPAANSSGSGNSGRDDVKTAFATEIQSSTLIESSEKKLKLKKEEKVKGSHQTVLIRIPARNKAATDATDAVDEAQCAAEDEEPVAKTWNLRPRRAVTKPPNANGAPVQEGKPEAQSQPELAVTRAAPEEKAAKKRQRFSVSLSKDEIEEDFLHMTGSKPPRRPKKRARGLRKQLDGIFPGLWLTSVTPDLYRVPDAPLKG